MAASHEFKNGHGASQRLLRWVVVLAVAAVLLLLVVAAQAVPSGFTRIASLMAALLVACVAGGVPWLMRRQQQQAHALAWAAQASSERQNEVLDALQAAVVLWDADDRLVSVNRDFLQVYVDMAPLMLPGVHFEDVLRASISAGLIPEAKPDPEAWVQRRLALRRKPQGPMLRETADGRWRRIVEQRLSDGSVLAHSVDVTELVHREKALKDLNVRLDEINTELSRLSETDALTSLANRRQFDRRLAEECARAARHGTPLALLMLDVDHFKRYNDLHGHPAGDACLRQVADALRTSSRRPADLVARVGGEEFAVLLPHHTLEEASSQASRFLAAMHAAVLPHGDSPVSAAVTFSVGGAQVAAPGAGFVAADLLREADAALYEAKQAGRDRVVMRALIRDGMHSGTREASR